MATYTNKNRQATTYNNRYNQGSAVPYDVSNLTYEDESLLYDTYGVATPYTNKNKSLDFIIWDNALDTWDEYTESWDEMGGELVYAKGSVNSSNYSNKPFSTGQQLLSWDDATDTWADYTETWDEMFTVGSGISYTNKVRNN